MNLPGCCLFLMYVLCRGAQCAPARYMLISETFRAGEDTGPYKIGAAVGADVLIGLLYSLWVCWI